jgi:hypothetical protein
MTTAIAPTIWPIALIASQFTASSRVKAVVAVAGHEDHQQYVPLFSRDRQGTSVPSSTRVPQRQLLKVCASLVWIINHTAPCAVKRRNRWWHQGWIVYCTAIIGAAGAILSVMSRFNEVASVFVRFDHVASVIINANHNIMWTAERLGVADRIPDCRSAPGISVGVRTTSQE